MDLGILLQGLVLGLLNGGVYALVAAGLTLIFGVMRILNLAHAEFLVLGLYLGYWLVQRGMDPYVTALVTVPAMSLVGVVAYLAVFRLVVEASDLTRIVVAVGLLFVVQNLSLFFFSGDTRSVASKYQLESLAMPAGVSIPLPQLIAFAGGIAATGALYALLRFTELGTRLRAASSNAMAAQLMGIDLRRMYLIAFAISGACVGLAASLLLPVHPFSPSTGGQYILLALAIVILGGLGNYVGALIGALIIGVGESLGALYLPGSLGPVVALTLTVLVLLFRPAGILGAR